MAKGEEDTGYELLDTFLRENPQPELHEVETKLSAARPSVERYLEELSDEEERQLILFVRSAVEPQMRGVRRSILEKLRAGT